MYVDPTYIPREMTMFLCDFGGQTKGGNWIRTRELNPAGSMKCQDCQDKENKNKREKKQ